MIHKLLDFVSLIFAIIKYYWSFSNTAKGNIRSLRDAVAKLNETNETAHIDWSRNLKILRSNILKRNVALFLSWPVIKKTMFVGDVAYIGLEINEIKQSYNFYTRYRMGLQESLVGLPTLSSAYPLSSPNLIHHCYSVYRFESAFGIVINSMTSVVEFGGGYGSMCRLFYNLGFSGTYTIYDFPEFNLLQDYYLRASHIMDERIRFANDLQALSHDQTKGRLLLATWSLSETPINFRNAFLNTAGDFDYYLIAFQDTFGNIDNSSYFTDLQASKPHHIWQLISIKHLPNNYYLLGRPS